MNSQSTPPSSDQRPRDHQPNHEHDTPASVPPKPRRRAWADIVEERIREAQQRGEFTNLPGAGKPLVIDENPWAGERALAYSLLKANKVAPREIALGREVDDELAAADALVSGLRRRRDHLARRRLPVFASERRAYNILREKTEARYAEALRAVASKVLSLNISTPTALHRPLVDIDARLAAFRAEFPPLPA